MTNKDMLKQLRDLGVETVVVVYDGSGDSGCVEQVTAMGKGKEVHLPGDISDAVGEAAERHLEEKGIDWFNNSGGYGTFTLDVKTGKRKLEHNERIEDSEYSEYEDGAEKEEEEAAPPTDASGLPVCTCHTLLNGHIPGCPYVKG